MTGTEVLGQVVNDPPLTGDQLSAPELLGVIGVMILVGLLLSLVITAILKYKDPK